MNRRNFAKAVIGSAGVSMVVPTSVAAPLTSPAKQLKKGLVLESDEGIKMKVIKHELATRNKDHKQFSLVLEVENSSGSLAEKIYKLTDSRGVKHDIYLKPMANNQLLAEFNWRTNA